MKRFRFSLFHPLWPAVALLAGLILVMTLTSAKALPTSPEGPDTPSDAPGGVKGYLYEPDEVTPVEGGWIHIEDAEEQPWMGTNTDPSGYFEIPNLPPGHYILRAHPPEGSTFAASLPQEVEVFSGGWSSKTLFLTRVGISGYVRDCDAIPEQRIEGAWVVAHSDDEEWSFQVWDSTNINGEFKLGGVATDTTYILQTFPPPESEYVPLDPITVTPVVTDVVLEMCIPPINVQGLVHDPLGNPVDGAWVVIWNEFYGDETGTELGHFFFRGLPLETDNVFWLHAGPPWGEGGGGLISNEPFTIEVPTPPLSVTVEITLPHAFKTVTGWVVFEDTLAGVPDAEITARRLDGPGFAGTATGPSGAFTVSLTGGEWHLAVRPSNPPAEWVWPGLPAWIVFDHNTTPQTETVDFKVIPTNARVTGEVVCPPSAKPCPPQDAIWVELRHDEIGNGAGVGGPPPNYPFEIPIPDGWYELVIHVDSPWWQGPEPIPVFVGPDGTYDVGIVPLLLKDAHIMGKVRNEMGVGVEGVFVVGWQPEEFGWGWAETDGSGTYSMPVIGGEWFVEPQPGPELPYVFNQHPQLVRVLPGGTVAGVDFVLASADSRIEGTAVDAGSYEPLWGLDGWAWAERIVPPPDEPEFFSDAPMWDSNFELKVKGDEEYWVGVHVPPHAPYVSGSTGPVPVPPGAQVPVAVPLEHKDAVIEGALVIAGTSPPESAHGVWAEVFGEDERGHWVNVGVDPDSAWYEMAVVSGTWHLRAWVDPASGFVAVPTTTLATVQSGQVLSFVNFEVWRINALINGTVRAPDGTPAEAFVFAEGESPHVGHFETRVWSDENGNFELLVPEGGYMVGAALPGDELEAMGWLNPRPIDVPWVEFGSPPTDLELRFRQLDGEIHGTVTFAPGIVVTPTHPAYVWGWADSGEWSEAEALVVSGTDTFTYSMRVVSDTVWHVGAVYEDWDNGVFYESPEEMVPVPPTPPIAQAFQDLELGGPWPLPQPFIVTFDGAYMQTIVLPDGVELNIPPRALVDSGTVTLFIFPTQELRPEPGREIIGAGYEMWAIDQNGKEITDFNKNVIMTFPYPSDVVLAQQGIQEHLLVPVYYSTLVGHWILAESYVLDTVNNEITLQINHFTKFGTLSTAPGEFQLYLPVVLRSGS
jgi:hypothetical protein